MKSEHLNALLWLRWRLRVNQWKRGGIVNVIFLAFVSIASGFAAVGLFVGGLLLGILPLAKVESTTLMYVWDGIIVGFLLWWMIGLVTELQRSETLSLEKLLHLPLSLSGAFLINYLGSLFSITLVIFVSGMAGLCLGLVFGRGLALLALVPLVLSFLLMITALTYQFQGWLAALMVNQRRRRTIIVCMTAGLIMLGQLPNLINLAMPWKRSAAPELPSRTGTDQSELSKSSTGGHLSTKAQEQKSQADRKAAEIQDKELKRQQKEAIGRIVLFVNIAQPLGWLPLGAAAAAGGNFVPALLGTMGLTLIGFISLRRSYRTTMRLYTGEYNAVKESAPVSATKSSVPTGPLLVERLLPGASEHTSAIAFAAVRSLIRAPEAKMMLLTPILMAFIVASTMLRGPIQMPLYVQPLLAFAATAMILLTMLHVIGNQFGFDRAGFRAYVLSPARRRDILLGKNLAVAPLACGMSMFLICLQQILATMRFDHFVAALVQSVSMFVLYCMLANWLSIFAPMPIAPGSLRPTGVKGLQVILQLAFVFVFPAVVGLTLFPLGIEFILNRLGWIDRLPVCLVLSVGLCVLVLWLYKHVLDWQGGVLHSREQKILEVVTSKLE